MINEWKMTKVLYQLDIKPDEAFMNVCVDVCQLSKGIMGIQSGVTEKKKKKQSQIKNLRMPQGGRGDVSFFPVSQSDKSQS